MSRWAKWSPVGARPRRLQLLRRCVQTGVVVIMLLIPTTARYHNYLMARQLDRNLEKWEGSAQGRILEALDGVYRRLPGGEKERVGRMVRDRDRALDYSNQLRGGPWSADLVGLSMTDPLAVVESVAAGRRWVPALWISILIPVALALLLGRVFCSWICPMNLLLEMTDKLRRLLRFLELRPRDMQFSRGIKYVLLVVGTVMAAALAVPVLGYVYPPAVIGREAHAFVFAFFDRAELGRPGLWFGGLSSLSLILLGIVAIEIAISRRWWCRYVCPGGALYILLGRWRPVRVRLADSACTNCAACVPVCPMGLNPMRDEMGSECDNCGLCISHCEPGALDYALELPLGKGGAS